MKQYTDKTVYVGIDVHKNSYSVTWTLYIQEKINDAEKI